jgi:hypothetical protein
VRWRTRATWAPRSHPRSRATPSWRRGSTTSCIAPERYERWRDYRVDPRGRGLHGLDLAPGEVVRLTQAEVEAHPAWEGFGIQAAEHPPMRGWLATAVCGEDGRRYGLLQLSDKADGADFTAEDADRLRELAAFTGATLDAFRAPRGATSD